MIRLPLIWLLIAVCALPASKYHAYEVFEGSGFVNLSTVVYRPRSTEISFSLQRFALNGQTYLIDYTEPSGPLTAYFGHRMVRGERVVCSFIAMPPEHDKAWTLLFTWQDSLKAFHATVATP